MKNYLLYLIIICACIGYVAVGRKNANAEPAAEQKTMVSSIDAPAKKGNALASGSNEATKAEQNEPKVEMGKGNKNANSDSKGKAAQLLEMPHLNPDNFFAPHYVDYNGKHIMNIAMEWDRTVRHATWVAFSWDATTSQDNVDRGNNWMWDPLIPLNKWKGVIEAEHKFDGFDKGHLCASEDRVYCREANDQTFFFSNVSPQMTDFDQKYWAGLEAMTRRWGRSTQRGKYDKVYVAKGGTVSERLLNFKGTRKSNDNRFPTSDANGLSKGGMAVPAYYFMAFLAVKNGKYQAIAFLVPHSENLCRKPASNSAYQTYAVSIDKLEEKTGIDFFCNLPDKTEDEVERAFSVSDWKW